MYMHLSPCVHILCSLSPSVSQPPPSRPPLQVWDLRKNAVLYRMKGHSDTVTGMALSPDGSYLLTNAMDNSLRIWDVRPFAPSERCLKILTGHQHNFEKVGRRERVE